jgi:hypothetical protein
LFMATNKLVFAWCWHREFESLPLEERLKKWFIEV